MAPIAKFGAMRTPTERRCSTGCVELAAEGLELRIVPAGGAHDNVDTSVDTVRHVGGRRVGDGELDDDIGTGQVAEVVPGVEGAHEAQTGGALDRAAHLRAHPAGGTDDGHPDVVRLARRVHGATLSSTVDRPSRPSGIRAAIFQRASRRGGDAEG